MHGMPKCVTVGQYDKYVYTSMYQGVSAVKKALYCMQLLHLPHKLQADSYSE